MFTEMRCGLRGVFRCFRETCLFDYLIFQDKHLFAYTNYANARVKKIYVYIIYSVWGCKLTLSPYAHPKVCERNTPLLVS